MSTQWFELERPPVLAPLFVRAALRQRPRGRSIPAIGARCPVAIDAAHLARYRQVCALPDSSNLPPVYPHLLAFGLQLTLLTDRRFPLPLMGLVHVGNQITVLRPLRELHRLTLSVQLTQLAPHRHGVTFDFLSELRVDQELVWHASSRYLSRALGLDQTPEVQTSERRAPAQLPPLAHWFAPSDTGRRYARVAHDFNPIHMSAASARLFGFPRAIAHGLWNKARAIQALSAHLPEHGYHVAVDFKRPVLLPAQVQLHASEAGANGEFALTGAPGTLHLHGHWRALS